MASASELEKGKCFEYKGDFYRVKRKELVAYGTHSHTKLKIIVEPAFGGGEKTFTFAHQDKVDVVDIIKKKAQVIAKSDNNLQIMDSQSYETFDAEADSEIMGKIEEGDIVIFVNHNNKTIVLDKARG